MLSRELEQYRQDNSETLVALTQSEIEVKRLQCAAAERVTVYNHGLKSNDLKLMDKMQLLKKCNLQASRREL